MHLRDEDQPLRDVPADRLGTALAERLVVRGGGSPFVVDGRQGPLRPSPVMITVDVEGLHETAEQCVALVAADFGELLDWSVDSLAVLDDVCARLLSDGPLRGDRLDLWWQLLGAYTGEVIVRAYGGQWITHERARGAYAVRARSVIGFPFGIANRILAGEPFKSLASFARALPVISDSTSPTAE